MQIILTFSTIFAPFIWNIFYSKFLGRKELIQPSRCDGTVKDRCCDYWDSKRFMINPQVSCTLRVRPNLLDNGCLLSQGVKLDGRETDFTLHVVTELRMHGVEPYLSMRLRVMVSN
jgi:hypothetical protein